MTEPDHLKEHVLVNLEARARGDMLGSHAASSRVPAHMLMALIAEVRASREILETKEEPDMMLSITGTGRLWAAIDKYASTREIAYYETDQGSGKTLEDAYFERDEALRQLILLIGDRPESLVKTKKVTATICPLEHGPTTLTVWTHKNDRRVCTRLADTDTWVYGLVEA